MDIEKIVYFDQWCQKCKHKDLPENDDPCDECLTYPAREYSYKPMRFVPKDGEDG